MEINIKKLPHTIEALKKIILLQQQEIDAHKQEMASQKDKYRCLLEQIRLEFTRRFSPSSEKTHPQPELFDEPGTTLTEEVKQQIADSGSASSTTPPRRHPIRRPLPKELPREVILHDILEAEKICDCGSSLVRIGEEISEQLKYIPAKLSVIQHIRPKYACKPCQENVKIAPMPQLLLPKCIATPELVSHVIISKYCDHLPLNRQEAIWKRFEIDLPRSSLCGWVMKTAELCEPLINELRQRIIAYDYVQADETTLQVLNESGRDNRTKSYMWAYRGGGEKPCIVYEYQATRGGYHAQQFLAGFKGYLQTDAFSGYNWAREVDGILSVGCHAHARRRFAEIVKVHKTPGLAQDALDFYRQLYAVEKEARDIQLHPSARYRLRQEKSQPLLEAFRQWLDHYLPKTSEQSSIGKAIRYCFAHWDALNVYLQDGRIEIDNNLIENAIRPFALGRKNWLFSGSPAGAKAGAILFSLIETCKANGVEPYHYFCAMLNRIRNCKSPDDYRLLLPQFINPGWLV